jgi:hypothetical protein
MNTTAGFDLSTHILLRHRLGILLDHAAIRVGTNKQTTSPYLPLYKPDIIFLTWIFFYSTRLLTLFGMIYQVFFSVSIWLYNCEVNMACKPVSCPGLPDGIFSDQNPQFWKVLKLNIFIYFMAIRNTFWSFVLFYGNLVYFWSFHI